nr:YbhB/YbcL family Raf kinase inhibitor-like protein [Variovorax sp. PBL-E5]
MPPGTTATGMRATSSAFADNGRIPAEHAGLGDCGGRNVSLPVAWSRLPAKVQSVAVLLSDPDGANGLGVSHWVAYNIPAGRGELKAGEAEAAAGFTIGPNVAGAAAYRGMCPPAGDLPHHYTLTVVASDLAPGALPAGLTRDALFAALKGHALGGQSVVGLYGR